MSSLSCHCEPARVGQTPDEPSQPVTSTNSRFILVDRARVASGLVSLAMTVLALLSFSPPCWGAENSSELSDWYDSAKIPEANLKVDKQRTQERLDAKLIESVRPEPPWTLPASSVMTPTAFGAQWTDFFLGVGVENRARFNTLANGTAHVGFGIGDIRFVALETSFSSYGLARHGLPYRIGGVSFKLHHHFLELGLSTAVGYENAIVWGDPDSGQSFFGVVSKYFVLGEQEYLNFLSLSLGVGDGRYRRETDVALDKQAPSLFASAGLRLVDPLGVILNWTGSDLAAGLSLAPFRSFPLVLTFGAIDIAHTAGDGDRQVLMISYGDSWKPFQF